MGQNPELKEGNTEMICALKLMPVLWSLMCYTGSDMDLASYWVDGVFPTVWKVDLDADSGVACLRAAVLQQVLHAQLWGLLCPANLFRRAVICFWFWWYLTALTQGNFKKLAGVMCILCWYLWTSRDAEAHSAHWSVQGKALIAVLVVLFLALEMVPWTSFTPSQALCSCEDVNEGMQNGIRICKCWSAVLKGTVCLLQRKDSAPGRRYWLLWNVCKLFTWVQA